MRVLYHAGKSLAIARSGRSGWLWRGSEAKDRAAWKKRAALGPPPMKLLLELAAPFVDLAPGFLSGDAIAFLNFPSQNFRNPTAKAALRLG
jgi:hypothetical protein